MKTIIVSAFLIFKMFFGQHSFAMEKESYPIDGGLADKFKYLVTQYEKGDYLGKGFTEQYFTVASGSLFRDLPSVSSSSTLILPGYLIFPCEHNTSNGTITISINPGIISCDHCRTIDDYICLRHPLGAFIQLRALQNISLPELHALFLKGPQTEHLTLEMVEQLEQNAQTVDLNHYALEFVTNNALSEQLMKCFKEYAQQNINIIEYLGKGGVFNGKDFKKKNMGKCLGTYGTVLFEKQDENDAKKKITPRIMFESILEEADQLNAQGYKNDEFINFYKYLSDQVKHTYDITTKKGRDEFLKRRLNDGGQETLISIITTLIDVFEQLNSNLPITSRLENSVYDKIMQKINGKVSVPKQ